MDFYRLGLELRTNPNELPQPIRLPEPKNINDYKKAPKLDKRTIDKSVIVEGKPVVTGYFLGNLGFNKKSKKKRKFKKRRKSKKRKKH